MCMSKPQLAVAKSLLDIFVIVCYCSITEAYRIRPSRVLSRLLFGCTRRPSNNKITNWMLNVPFLLIYFFSNFIFVFTKFSSTFYFSFSILTTQVSTDKKNFRLENFWEEINEGNGLMVLACLTKSFFGRFG